MNKIIHRDKTAFTSIYLLLYKYNDKGNIFLLPHVFENKFTKKKNQKFTKRRGKLQNSQNEPYNGKILFKYCKICFENGVR